jgi:aminoglycoside/choline kinase family phosphotransferase
VPALLPATTGQRAEAAWADRRALLDAADRLPQTFCHRDYFNNNLFGRRLSDGQEQTVAIDWALAGPGPVGEDAFRMAWVTAYVLSSELSIRELDAIVFESYLAGLRDAGWSGDASAVRLGYASWALAAPVVAGMLLRVASQTDADPVDAAGRGRDRLIETRSECLLFLLDLADEARPLLRSL